MSNRSQKKATEKPLIIYKDRSGRVLAEVPAPTHVVVFNSLVRIVDRPEDFTLHMDVVGIRYYKPEKDPHVTDFQSKRPRTLQERKNELPPYPKTGIKGWALTWLN